MHPYITNKRILVTGAAGSIGSALCVRLLASAPSALVCLNLTEHGLVALEETLTPRNTARIPITYLLGSILDTALLAYAMGSVHTVIHTAAYKYIQVCEANVCAAVRNNVEGSLRVFQAAKAAGVERCVLISSDKAVQAVSIMGKTKALAERLCHSMGPGFVVVRFGNVLDSSGSVLPRWRAQIAQGGPLTVTHPDCTRYFMSVDDACTLIIDTLTLDATQGTYVCDMGEPQSIDALARACIAASGMPCEVVYSGLRPGETLTEVLYEGDREPTAQPGVWRVADRPALSEKNTRLQFLLTHAKGADEAETSGALQATLDAADPWRAFPGPYADDAMSFITYKWRGTDPQRSFQSQHANVLYAMLARHYHAPFTLTCVTDDPGGLRPEIVPYQLPATRVDALGAPRHTAGKLFPACYRRLWLFSHEAEVLGKRICLVDLDVIILGDITALLQSKTADFVGWCDGMFGWAKIAGGFWCLNTGSHPEVWEAFDPQRSPQMAAAAGHNGSDQAWLSHMLYPPKEAWTADDGVVKIGWLRKGGLPPPPGIKMVFTIGVSPPWDAALQRGHRWIAQHWREGA